MRLDFSKPFAEVYGLPGAKYEQNGKIFRGDGKPAALIPYPDETPPEPEGEYNPISLIEQPTVVEKPEGETFETMNQKSLQAAVEIYGGTWTNRQAALEYLGRKK